MTKQTREILEQLSNFNLIKYTGHYVLTIDRGMGKPIIYEGDTIEDVLQQLTKEIEQYVQTT